MKSYAIVVLCVVALAGMIVSGCVSLTPEQQQKVDTAKAAYSDAEKTAEKVKATFDAYVKEYDAIKARVDAGEAIPAVLVTRYQQLLSLITQGKHDVVEAVAKVTDAKKALADALGAGVPWYAAIPWGTILTGLLCLVGGYVPAAAPAIAAAKAIIAGVSEFAKADPAAGQKVKDAVLVQSRVLGVEGKVDALVQKFDPPK